ncbi:protein serine/threonine kinase, putative [Entamoeba invadens IP1]|uniref:Protein serine/threonine kinase, putative n=1 Tax=Entamoeba invadens IP1 TaxID=370355 RepID=A0A0A1UFN2_ENTIV|nr:protein serine/threonine kinase, putative [Entamoeba invadens IP1]ELP91763.1 protein serine/threonine kinase, putative [Entamoeba invadens IP1]|eukprot:XP_004258534.1 protein serine/threonine kinase, putative [Entamoeba invadens IP1]
MFICIRIIMLCFVYCALSEEASSCLAGFYLDVDTCVFCPIGYYCPLDGIKIPCNPGNYSDIRGHIYCKLCPAGTYSIELGSTNCDTCPFGSYSLIGATFCTACTSSTCDSCSSTTGKCLSCSVGCGFVSDGICKACEAGYFSLGGTASCSKCPTNLFSTNKSSSCTPCNSACKTCDDTNGNCLTCYENSFISNSVCVGCPAGQFYSSDGCLDCAEQTYSLANSTVCTSCSSCVACDKTNGHCTLCEKGQFIDDYKCIHCKTGTYGNGFQCIPCQKGTYSSLPGSDKCIQCEDGYYTNNTSSILCLKCNSYCNSCEKESGYCSSCVSGCVLSGNYCIPCEAGTRANQETNKCDVCPAGTHSSKQSTTCLLCGNGFYSTKGSLNCLSCSLTCLTCNNTNGNCITCISGNGLDVFFNCHICPAGTYANSTNNKCQHCEDKTYQSNEGQTFCNSCNIKCETCDKISGECLTCYAGYGLGYDGNCELCPDGYYSNGGTSKCLPCPGDCLNCFKESGECTTCQSGNKQVTNQNTGNKECVSCSLNNNCALCDLNINEYERNCVECSSTYYLKDNNCYVCSQITNCVQCSPKSSNCLMCSGEYITVGEKCISCEEGKVKVTSNICMNCFELIPNCQLCEYNNGKQKCLKCNAPYVLNNDYLECLLAYSNNTHFGCDTSESVINIEGCINQVNSSCFMCNDKCILIDGKCIEKQNDKCFNYSLKSCDNCLNNVITTNGDCSITSTCKYQLTQNDKTTCLIYKNNTQEGIKANNCRYIQNEFCYLANDGYYTTLDINGETSNCENAILCKNENGNKVDISCKSEFVMTKNVLCSRDLKCADYNGSVCIACQQNHHIENGGCVFNDNECVIQNKEICILCKNKITINGKCVLNDSIICKEFVGNVCKQCEEDHYKDTSGCLPKQDKYKDCEYVSVIMSSCLECYKSHVLVDNICVSSDEYNNTVNLLNIQTMSKTPTDNCILRSSKGCLRCSDGYYISNSVCVKCEYPCTYCSNLTYCTKCNAYSYTKNGKCFEINEILSVCDVMMSTYVGCVVCKDGYMRSSDGKQCISCDRSCATCSNDGDCVVCSDGYYRTPNNNTKLCNSQTELNNCLNKTTSGCTLCESGFAPKDNLCYKCGENCTFCDSTFECSKCDNNNILKDGVCVHFSQIPNCISSQNSLCWECADGYKLRDDKIECFTDNNYGLIVGIPIMCVVVMVVVIIATVIIVVLIVFKKKDDKLIENVCVFKMSRSNITMTKLEGEILSNKNEISFGDENDKIHIETESRELLCVGNSSKGNMKIQITTKDKCDKYKIRTEPKIVTLKSGFACEFEIFLTPYCTMNLSDKIMIISLNLKSGKQNSTSIAINGQVENSTHLDYDELIEEKKIGEGTFGVVYKGKYRGNTVAIKKMKEFNENNIEEFTKEVAMLDKFRSEYITHFYGAVFIEKKQCMVTEFASYGSLKDVLKHKTSKDIDMKLRVKFCLDAAKGILYLHENDILHRDIKPDNYLIFSLDSNEKVNAKLTDFGSARNVNLLMTNMTFTKGVGTPKYMAPEVLDKKKYKKPADIFSFAITMYEIILWEDAFQKSDSRFKYAWDIADFTSAGKRLVIPKDVPNELSFLITKCWAQELEQRIKIQEIVENLEQTSKFN